MPVQVSCFGDDKQTDTGDVWTVVLEQGQHTWHQNHHVRFRHEDTGMWLSSSTKRYGRPIAGQQEIFGSTKKDGNGLWAATEGVLFPERTEA